MHDEPTSFLYTKASLAKILGRILFGVVGLAVIYFVNTTPLPRMPNSVNIADKMLLAPCYFIAFASLSLTTSLFIFQALYKLKKLIVFPFGGQLVSLKPLTPPAKQTDTVELNMQDHCIARIQAHMLKQQHTLDTLEPQVLAAYEAGNMTLAAKLADQHAQIEADLELNKSYLLAADREQQDAKRIRAAEDSVRTAKIPELE